METIKIHSKEYYPEEVVQMARDRLLILQFQMFIDDQARSENVNTQDLYDPDIANQLNNAR